MNKLLRHTIFIRSYSLILFIPLIALLVNCKTQKFSKKYDCLVKRKIERIGYGKKEGTSSMRFLGKYIAYGSGASYDSVRYYYKNELYTGKTAEHFNMRKYGDRKVDLYSITDYENGVELGSRNVEIKNNKIIFFEAFYPSISLRIEMDSTKTLFVERFYGPDSLFNLINKDLEKYCDSLLENSSWYQLEEQIKSDTIN